MIGCHGKEAGEEESFGKAMKQRVADFIADYLVQNNVTQIFSVVGGGAMHLNNAFGINKKLNVTYNHHEQASVIAAESYSRINNQMAAVCVTSGPGGTNALTGVLCAYQDSLPVIVISGQVRYDTTVESTGLNLRQFGEQEYHIIKSAAPMTKYAVMVTDANTIKYHLGKALYLARTGRRGPCWIDVPLNVQGQVIETDELTEFIPEEIPKPDKSVAEKIIREMQVSKRPVIIAGAAIRKSGSLKAFYQLVERLKLPVVCTISAIDVMAADDMFYYGTFGNLGGRTGNFIVQNADLIISLGSRLAFKHIGFNYKSFAPNAKKIVVDIDPDELKKKTMQIDIPLCMDVKDVINELCELEFDLRLEEKKDWYSYCDFLKQKFNTPRVYNRTGISVYQFSQLFFDKLDINALIVMGNNCAASAMHQTGIKIRGQRIYANVNCGTMGYDLPASIGAAIASGKTVFCLTGEGSFQMNIQELQTIVHNNFPVKIVVFNNNSYQAIVNTQTNFFNGVFAGCTNDSGISFPSFEKIANAYDFPFLSIKNAADIERAIEWLLNMQGRAMLELVQTEPDPIEPRSSGKKLDDGSMVSPPIDDLSPFLPREEYDQCSFAGFIKDKKSKT